MSVLAARGRGPSTPATPGPAAAVRLNPLAPDSALPMAYFAFAHASLALAFGALVVWPALPGGFFYHPKMIAIVHLLTIGWISGSILGSFYLVAPLALGVAMPVRRLDWAAFASFAAGAVGMVSHFWIGTYDGMAWSAGMVLAAIARVGWRASRGLSRSPVPAAVSTHVRLAFVNIMAAGTLGILIGLDRTRGFLGLSPVAATYTHAHLAAVGWAMMMVVGLAYRLIPMMLPSAMPKGRALWASAVLLEGGLVLLTLALFTGWPLVPAAGAWMLAGLVTFVFQIARTAVRRLPRPPALPRPDWSIRQVHLAFLWLVVACVLGYRLSRAGASPSLTLSWIYGTAGLLGFLAQMIVGMHGRLVPYYAWYRALAARPGERPPFSVHGLSAPRLARAVFVAWTAGVPLLAWGLSAASTPAIRWAAALLLAGLALHAWHLVYMLYQGRTPAHAHHAARGTDRRGAAHAAREEPRPHAFGARDARI